VALRTIEPRFGWRWMFLCGLVLALLIAALTLLSPESSSWKNNQLTSFGEVGKVLWQHKKDFAYLVLMMTAITCLSHGTQDLYPDFLKTVHGFSNNVVSNLAILYNVGAIAGALVIAHYSDRLGRRYAVILALLISALSIPLWAFGSTIMTLALGSFLMQFGVQGAFGVIPAHLNELSPSSVRSLFPGVVYQLGVLLGAPAVVVEFALRRHFGYQWALTIFEICVIITLFLIFGFGPERKGRDFAA
jgi:SHS family lactate transporter-like MFS transporter